MSFREVRVFEVREVLRLWLRGEGLRSVERLAGMDRKTVRRYVEAAVDTGLDRDGGEDQLNDVFLSLAADHGPAIGAYAAVILDHPLPWTKMRQVYALLGLVKKWGPARVDEACAKAAQAEAYSVSLIGRMLERATEANVEQPPIQGTLLTGRFVRPPEDFRLSEAKGPVPDATDTADRAADASTAGGAR
jgi:hypothetical protein